MVFICFHMKPWTGTVWAESDTRSAVPIKEPEVTIALGQLPIHCLHIASRSHLVHITNQSSKDSSDSILHCTLKTSHQPMCVRQIYHTVGAEMCVKILFMQKCNFWSIYTNKIAWHCYYKGISQNRKLVLLQNGWQMWKQHSMWKTECSIWKDHYQTP